MSRLFQIWSMALFGLVALAILLWLAIIPTGKAAPAGDLTQTQNSKLRTQNSKLPLTPTPTCCESLSDAWQTTCALLPGGLRDFGFTLTITNPCTVPVTITHFIYLEVSSDGVNFGFIRRTSPTNEVLQPGPNVISNTYANVDVPPNYWYYRIRAHILPFAPCNQFDFYSPISPICGTEGTATPGGTPPTATPTITSTPTEPPLTPTSTRTPTTATLTATPTTATLTATPTPPLATLTPTPSPTPTSTASPTPSATTTPLPNCTPTWNLIPGPKVGGLEREQGAVAAISATDIWAVWPNSPLSNTIQMLGHWDGVEWRAVASPNISGSGLYDLAAIAANNVWAVGQYTDGATQALRTLVEHWDGAAWSVIPSPNMGTQDNVLYSISAASANDIWAVGYYQQAFGVYQLLTMHWDGELWSIVPIEAGGRILWDVSAISADDVWAVGDRFNGTQDQALVEHWDGNQWSAIPSPNLGVDNVLLGVAALAANDVWAVGLYLEDSPPPLRPLIEDWEGTPETHPVSRGPVVRAVQPLIEHWDGTTWSVVPSPNLGRGGGLTEVVAISPGDVWAVGGQSHDNPNLTGAVTLHWNGAQWRIVPNPEIPGAYNGILAGVTALSADDVWTVGTYLTLYDDGHPVVDAHLLVEHMGYFIDVHPGDYFYEAVRYLYCHAAISGYSDNTFRPYNLTTRAQLTKIVTLAEGWPLYTPPTPTFRDVPASHTFYQYIETAYAHGIISGYGCGNDCLEFRPGNNVTRAQLCKIVVLAEGWPTYTPPSPTFRDVPTSDPFFGHVETAYAHGIISGYNCGPGCLEFRPGNNATRGQIAKIVHIAITGP